MRIIAIANQKGGCGKTTVVINLGACLAREGRRVLAVDLDPQGHCALGLAVPEEQVEQSISDVLLGVHDSSRSVDLTRVIWQIASNFDLIPSKFDLSRLEQQLAGVPGREQYMRRALMSVADRYDFVLVDSPPTVGFLTQNALHAADEIVVPVDTGYFSLQGLSRQLQTIRELRATCDRPLTLRILANLYDVRTKLGREILAELRKRHGDAMFTTFVNFNTKLKESSSLGQPITEYDPSSIGCKDFVRLARELIAFANDRPTPVLRSASMPAASITSPAIPSPSVPASLLEQADALAENASKLLATTQTLLGPARDGQGHKPQPPTPEEIEQKIEALYGVRPVHDGIEFVLNAPGARLVRLAGDFNNWQPDSTPMSSPRAGMFQVKLQLPPGRYSYRYVIDGQWRNDPANQRVEPNPFGELNSIVEVR